MRIPRVYLGTMTFGWQQSSSPIDVSTASEMLKLFSAASLFHVDTARIYSGGVCEAILGDAVRASGVKGTFKVGSKAHPSQGSLSSTSIAEQLAKSLRESKLDCLDEYYLHSPDSETPLLESLMYLHSQVQSGKIKVRSREATSWASVAHG